MMLLRRRRISGNNEAFGGRAVDLLFISRRQFLMRDARGLDEAALALLRSICWRWKR
jgi:hypothetical protein